MQKRNLLYYLFAAFIVAIFLWWWVLLFQKNENVYREKKVLYDLIVDIDTSETTRTLYEQEVAALDRRYARQKAMITWEGAAFLLLLILGIVRLNRYFQQEIELARQQSNFLLSITHELRSPLASALLNIQTLRRRPDLPPEKQQRLLSSSQEELGRLGDLVEKLLFAARIGEGPIEHDSGIVDLEAVFGALLSGFRERYGRTFDINVMLDGPLHVRGDEVLLSSILVNLTDNAAKYCPPGGAIDIACRRKDGRVELTVANEGSGISDEEKKKVWSKFYRVGDERVRSSTGTGLGLYIVKRIAEAHEGSVGVADRPGGGVVFSVLLPAANPGGGDEAPELT